MSDVEVVAVLCVAAVSVHASGPSAQPTVLPNVFGNMNVLFHSHYSYVDALPAYCCVAQGSHSLWLAVALVEQAGFSF